MGANPNTLTSSFQKFWSRRLQITRTKINQYHIISNYEEKAQLKKGNQVTRPYKSEPVVNDMGADGSYSRQAITTTEELLNIDREKEITFYIREIDELQSNYNLRNEFADLNAKKLANQIDADVLEEALNGASKVGAYDIAGTGTLDDGIGFTLSISNIMKVFGVANKKLTALNVDLMDRWAMVSPQFYNILWEYIAGKESLLGDKSGETGSIGTYGGFRLYVSNNLTTSYRLEMATTPTDTNTVVINGVTFTAETGDASDAAGKFKAETSGTVSLGHLADAINNANGYAASVGAAGTYTEVTAANRLLLKNIRAEFTAGNEYLVLVCKGISNGIVVSETLAAAADVWTTTKQLQHQMFGQGKPVDLVIQKDVTMAVKSRDGYIGNDIVNWAVWGKKTFTEGTKQIVNVLTIVMS